MSNRVKGKKLIFKDKTVNRNPEEKSSDKIEDIKQISSDKDLNSDKISDETADVSENKSGSRNDDTDNVSENESGSRNDDSDKGSENKSGSRDDDTDNVSENESGSRNDDSNNDSDDASEEESGKGIKKKKNKKESKVKKKIQELYEAKNWKWIFGCFVAAFFEDVILEIMGRRSFTGAFKFMFSSPLIFFINILIIFATMLIGLLFRKRLFFIFLGGLLWMVMGFINFMVLGYRITPFSAIDFLMAMDVISMMNVYFNKFQQILIFAGIGVVIFLVILLFIWTPKVLGKLKRLLNLTVCAGVFTLSYVLINIATQTGMISDDFSNLGNAYRDYGFVYCFANSIVDIGISKPDGYSEDEVKDVIYDTDVDYNNYLETRGEKKTPNIIIVQLESFVDIDRFAGIHTDIDSVPNFNKYMEEYPSGYLTVPQIGAGTANVECEVITGMKTGLFGAGEYPYKTVLSSTPCESLAQVLKRQGYTTFAMHNNKAVFYSRNDVYNQLGFDYFDSQEYMSKLTYTSTGWAKDEYLVNEIKRCMDSTESDDDFIHCISVQGHGKYPEDDINCVEHVKVTRDDGNQSLTNQYGYYVNQCYEMDEFIGNLKEMLDKRKEEYVLIVYGDHLPSIPFEMEDIIKGNEFQTEYVIINNIGLDLPKQDMATYEMSDYLLTALNLDKGIYQRIHTTYSNRDAAAYVDALHMIQYDMLYGDKYIYSYIPEYYESDMTMGIYPVSVKDVTLSSNQILVHGENFTEFSTVVLNDERLVTTFVNDRTLIVAYGEYELLKKGDTIRVEQIDRDKHLLSESINEIVYDPGY
ncbi:Phosphoglycerol transferase MdoB [Eubacterium ruminantium]|nr:Phosphoglycerol transferase MdoB [Eubacterium ruminantium]